MRGVRNQRVQGRKDRIQALNTLYGIIARKELPRIHYEIIAEVDYSFTVRLHSNRIPLLNAGVCVFRINGELWFMGILERTDDYVDIVYSRPITRFYPGMTLMLENRSAIDFLHQRQRCEANFKRTAEDQWPGLLDHIAISDDLKEVSVYLDTLTPQPFDVMGSIVLDEYAYTLTSMTLAEDDVNMIAVTYRELGSLLVSQMPSYTLAIPINEEPETTPVIAAMIPGMLRKMLVEETGRHKGEPFIISSNRVAHRFILEKWGIKPSEKEKYKGLFRSIRINSCKAFRNQIRRGECVFSEGDKCYEFSVTEVSDDYRNVRIEVSLRKQTAWPPDELEYQDRKPDARESEIDSKERPERENSSEPDYYI